MRGLSIAKFKLFFAANFLFSIFCSSNAFAAVAKSQSKMSLWELIVSGGWVMIPLAVISVIALALIFYHLRYITVDRLVPRDSVEYLYALLEKAEWDKALDAANKTEHIPAYILRAGLKKQSKSLWAVEEAMNYEGKDRIEKLWNGLNYLADLAAIAPMLGLLGTVLGMIQAFDYQAFSAGSIQPISLAQGLSKAMITTAFGLIIAVPILCFYAFFRKTVGRITARVEQISSEMYQLISAKSRQA